MKGIPRNVISKYKYASFIIISGVCIHFNIYEHKILVVEAIATEITAEIFKLIIIYLYNVAKSWAPNFWAMGIPNPPQHPLQNPNIRVITEVPAPTAAREFIPRDLPTITASTIEYVCCKRLPNKRGTVNLNRIVSGGPDVIFLELTIFNMQFDIIKIIIKLKNPL